MQEKQRPLFVPTETMAVAVRTPDQLLVGFLHAPLSPEAPGSSGGALCNRAMR